MIRKVTEVNVAMSSYENGLGGEASDLRNLQTSAEFFGVEFDANDLPGTRARIYEASDLRNLQTSAE